MTVSICIFAHNEEWLLPDCIGALEQAAGGVDYHAHILVNGATDNTIYVAQTFAAVDPRISVVQLPVADKANAWNDYVFRIAGNAEAHIFLDGDMKPSAGSIAALAQALKNSPDAYGAAALPITGRSQRAWARRLFDTPGLSGNLYALSGGAIDEFRRRSLRLPFGAKGEDGLISYLLLTDFEAGGDDSHTERIIVDTQATFEFDSLAPRPRDIATYHRRLKRYAERHFQKKVLYRLLKEKGAMAMPDNIDEIYSPENLASLRPRIDPINFWYDRFTLARLRNRDRGRFAQAG